MDKKALYEIVGNFLESKSVSDEIAAYTEAFSEKLEHDCGLIQNARGAFYTTGLMQEKLFQEIGREFVGMLFEYYRESAEDVYTRLNEGDNVTSRDVRQGHH